MKIPDSIKNFAREIEKLGATTYLNGGWVRDYLRGEKESHDYDLEIYGFPQLGEYLKANYVVNLVGESFTIYKAEMLDDNGNKIIVDISLPRTERLAEGKKGHKAFEIRGDAFLDPKEGCRRRDITANSILFNVLTGEVLDFYGGQEDIANKIIRVVDPETFIEDSLRVLRIAQFAARFNFTVHPDTVKLCRSIDLSDLPAERLWGEFEKWLLSANPSVGLKYFFELGIEKLFPMDEVLSGWQIRLTGQIMDVIANWNGLSKSDRISSQLSVLLGLAENPEKFLDILKLYTYDGYDVRKNVLALLKYGNVLTEEDVRRASTKIDLGIYCTVEIARSKVFGATTDHFEWVEEYARSLDCFRKPLKPILMGQHLVDLGMLPGKEMGKVLKDVFELQLQGKVTNLEEAIEAGKCRING